MPRSAARSARRAWVPSPPICRQGAVFVVTALLAVPALLALPLFRDRDRVAERSSGDASSATSASSASTPVAHLPRTGAACVRRLRRAVPTRQRRDAAAGAERAGEARRPRPASWCRRRSSCRRSWSRCARPGSAAWRRAWAAGRSCWWASRHCRCAGCCSSSPGAVPLVAIQVLDGVSATVFGLMVPLIAADLTRRTGYLNFAIGLVRWLAAGLGATASTTAAGWLADTFGASGRLSRPGAGRRSGAAAGLAADAGDPPRQAARRKAPATVARLRRSAVTAASGPDGAGRTGETSMPEAPHLTELDGRLPVPARIHPGGAGQARQQHLGLSDRRHRDRDDAAAQSRGAGCDRAAAARAARCVQGGRDARRSSA